MTPGLFDGPAHRCAWCGCRIKGKIAQPTPDAPTVPALTVAYGSVRGRIQTVSSRGGLRFTLYDINDDKPVSCFVDEKYGHRLPELWGKVAIVEGRIRRDPMTGHALTIRQIESINVVESAPPGAWQGARAALRDVLSGTTSDAVIRGDRDQ